MRAHLIGICGTAMAGIASMLKDSGMEVQGSDLNAYPPMSTLLADRGIAILKGYEAGHLDPRPDVVVVGNVARRDNPEVVAAQRLKIPLRSMPQIIRERFLGDRTSVTIAGTHGKTTTTSMLAWLLAYADQDPSYLVGGIPLNFGANYRFGRGEHFVIEGDEYDTAFFDKKAKFFHYNPTFTVLTSLEYDHADIYPDFATLKQTFVDYARLVNPGGAAVYCADYPVLDEVVSHCRAATRSYGFSVHADWRIEEFAGGPRGTVFRLREKGSKPTQAIVRMWGAHNVLNATAAFALGRAMGLPADVLLEGLATFKGVMRRFQTVAQEAGVTVIDDFAHHPTAVRETIQATRTRFPEARIFAVYHFESNTSRRKVFEADYARAFAGADRVYLTYPLRKQDDLSADQTLDPQAVLAGVRRYAESAHAYQAFPDMAEAMLKELRPSDVVIAMSGRDLTPLYDVLIPGLRTRNSAAGEWSRAEDLPAR